MDVTVFDVSDLTPYTFLFIKRGTVAGDLIESSAQATGVFKHRTGMTVSSDQETRESSSTLHVRPTESFVVANDGNLIGHGIRVEGRDYAITGQTGGKNYHTGTLEHYRLTLKASDFSDYEEQS